MDPMNYKQAAAYLQMSKSALYHMKSRGHIPILSNVYGRKRLFDREAINHWLKAGSPPDWQELIKKFYEKQEKDKRAHSVLRPAAIHG